MNIYIFGAGASRASQIGFEEGYTLRAPLVDDLFDKKYKAFAKSVGLEEDDLEQFREEFKSEGGSLESWLTEKWENLEKIKTVQKKNKERKVFGLLTFYVWWMMQWISSKTYNSSNAYNGFLKEIVRKDESFGLINFNYDTLLDRAYKDQAGAILSGNLENYVKWKYIKPHGSVNWLLVNREGDQEMDLLDNVNNLGVKLNLAASQMFSEEPISMNGLQILDPNNDFLNEEGRIVNGNIHNRRGFYYPLILLPLSSKLYEQVKGFKEKIVEEGTKMLSKAKEIYLIGYRAEDDVIKEMFQNVNPGTILNIVGRTNAESIFNNVVKWKPGLKKGLIFRLGFEKFYETKL